MMTNMMRFYIGKENYKRFYSLPAEDQAMIKDKLKRIFRQELGKKNHG